MFIFHKETTLEDLGNGVTRRILGGLFACGSVLLREAMSTRNPLPEQLPEPVTE